MLLHLLHWEGRRLVTLTGTGGVGKTRLALEAARQVAGEYEDGAAFVSLAPIADPTLLPTTILGDAHVIRNAGNRASDDAIRSLIVSSHLLGTNEYLVIHHTDRGMLTFTNEDLREKLSRETWDDASGIDFLPFPDLQQRVRDDVKRIK